MKNPGYEVDLWVTASMRTIVKVWLGHRTLTAALDDDSLQVDGSPSEITEFRDWFALGHFARRDAASLEEP